MIDASDLPTNTPPNAFMANLQTYFSEHIEPPSIDEWIALNLTDYQQKLYKLLMEERTGNSHYPIDFDDLFPYLGYERKRTAKKLLKSYTPNKEYISVEIIVGGNIIKKQFLKKRTAQQIALSKSRGKHAADIAEFYVEVLEVIQGFHVLSVMYQQKEIELKSVADALMTCYCKQPVVYIGDIGIHSGKHVMVFGATYDIVECNTLLNETFDKFTLRAVYRTDFCQEVNIMFKENSFTESQVDVQFQDGSRLTSCLLWNKDMDIDQIYKIWGDFDNEILSKKRSEHEQYMAQLKEEVEKVEAECQVRIDKANAYKEQINEELQQYKAQYQERIAEIHARKAEIERRMIELQQQYNDSFEKPNSQ